MPLCILVFPDTLTANKSLFHIKSDSFLRLPALLWWNAYAVLKSPAMLDTTLHPAWAP